MERLKGKVAVVTGAARGIGRNIVETFLAEGARMVYALDITPGEYTHPHLAHVALNVTDRSAVAAFAQRAQNEVGQIDVLVNNAGVTKDKLLAKMTEEDWDFVLDVNLKGVFNLTQAVSNMMIAQGSGSIVNISSVVGEYGNVGQTNYAATKAGLIGMTYTWAKEFTRKGAAVRTNAVAPGYIETEMVLSVPDKILDTLRQKTPMGRLGKPQEVANAVLFLASDESSYVNGHVLAVNGGLRL